MTISRNLWVSLIVVTLVAFSVIAVLAAASSSGQTLAVASAPHAAEMTLSETVPSIRIGAVNPNPPGEVVKLVFVHHSVGYNWLDDGNGDLGAALGANNYYVSDTYYDWGPPDADLGWGTIGDHTDIGHWYNWFVGPHRDIYVSALYATTNQNATYTRPMADPGGENEIVMFKSCFPNSELKGNPDDPPTSGYNPLRGLGASSQHHTVGNAKGIYNDILEYFETQQDKLFVVIAAPPVLDETYAENARAFNNWLVHEWLADYPYHNVAVFDFYNVLTTNGGSYDINDYGWPTGNHHRVVTTTMPVTIEHITDGDDDDSPNILEYPDWGSDNHPSSAGNQKATGEFVPLLNVYYNCWKHGDCWFDAADWISVTAAPDVASVYPGEVATYSISVTASEGYSEPVTLNLQGEPGGAAVFFDPNPVTPPGDSQLHVTTSASTVAGTYAMTVTGTSGTLTDTADLTLIVASAEPPSFTLSVFPTTALAEPGEVATYTVSVSASEGFTEPVALDLQGEPAEAVVSFDPNPVTPPGDSQLYVTTSASTVAGIYTMTVTGTAGALTDTADLTLIMASAAPLSFTLDISPTAAIAEPGEVATYTVSVSASEGFTEPVALDLQGEPAEAVVSFGPNLVTPPGNSQLYVTTTVSTVAGVYAMTVTGTSGVLTDTANLTLIVTSAAPLSFTLNISPTTAVAEPNQSVSFTVSVTGSNGFSQPVSLTVVGLPSGVSAAWSANPVTPDDFSILTLSVSSNPSFGCHSLNIVGTSDTHVVTRRIELVIDYPYKSYLPVMFK